MSTHLPMLPTLACIYHNEGGCMIVAVLQIKRDKRNNLGIIGHITPLKCML